jgi:hypothetical protein
MCRHHHHRQAQATTAPLVYHHSECHHQWKLPFALSRVLKSPMLKQDLVSNVQRISEQLQRRFNSFSKAFHSCMKSSFKRLPITQCTQAAAAQLQNVTTG